MIKWKREKKMEENLKMPMLTIEKASIADAELLTKIKKKTFDEEARKWLTKQEDIIDYNIQPSSYASIEAAKYMIRELNYYKIICNGEIVGGIVVTLSGKTHGRIDRLFIIPAFQGKGIGSKVIGLLEESFPNVLTWDLETSSRQLNNHYFYEKLGFKKTFQTEEEYGYEKRKKSVSLGVDIQSQSLEIRNFQVQNKDLSNIQYENCGMVETDYYQVNLTGSSFGNSNLMKSHFNNCNLSHSKFQNINLRDTLIADLNLSNSEFMLVTLGGVHFTDTNLGETKAPLSFERCDLEGSKFIDCNLKNIDIQQSEFSGMKINGILVEELLEAYYQVTK